MIIELTPQVWRHSCMSLSRTTGKFKLVENGNVALEKYTNETYNYLQKIPFVVSITHILDFFSRRASYILGRYFHPGLFLPRSGGPVHVHVRVGDGRPGVQQGAEHRGDGGGHLLQTVPPGGHPQLGPGALGAQVPLEQVRGRADGPREGCVRAAASRLLPG